MGSAQMKSEKCARRSILQKIYHRKTIRVCSTNRALSGRFVGHRENHGRFARQDAERERLLQIELDHRIRVTEVPDGNVLADVEFEVASARGQHTSAF